MSEKFYAYLSALASSVFYSLNQIFNKRVTLVLGTLPALVIVYAFLTLFVLSVLLPVWRLLHIRT